MFLPNVSMIRNDERNERAARTRHPVVIVMYALTGYRMAVSVIVACDLNRSMVYPARLMIIATIP